MSRDPFTQLYDRIINVFGDHQVRVTSFNTTRDPAKQELAAADFPELQLRPVQLTAMLGSTSSSTDVTRTYELGMNTGDQRLGELLHPVEWKMLKALHHMRYGALEELSFVKAVAVSSATSGMSDPANRGIEGWSGLYLIDVMMAFTRQEMEAK